MKEKYTHVAVVLDRSGSMSSMAKEVIGGVNNLLDEQKKVDGTASLTLVQFDDIYEVVHDFVNIKDIPAFDNFTPRGWTALLDAMGKTMNSVREKIEAMADADKPSKALFVFITDGQENRSTEYNRARVFEMIEDLKTVKEGQTAYDFVFIGANQDAIAEGGGYGIRANSSLTFDASGAGATQAFRSLSKGMTSYRSAAAATCYSFSEDDRKEQEELKTKDIDVAFKAKQDKYARGAIPTSISDLS